MLLGVTPEQPLALSNFATHASRDTRDTSVLQRQSSQLDFFLKLLQEYRPSAPWITQELLELSFNDFEKALSAVIELLTQAEKRWFYFCDKPQGYDQDAYWQQCLWQCMYYTQWLERLYVTSQGELFYKDSDTTRVPALACSVFEYISMMNPEKNNGDHPVYMLYAFYADCLAHFFCLSVDYASRSREDTTLYISSWVSSKVCLERLERVLEQLQDTRWYAPYYLTIKRYQEVYRLLDEEFLFSL